MDLEFKKIYLSKVEHTGIITLNRPDIKNMLSFDTFKELDYGLKLFESDEKIRIIFLKSNCTLSSKNNKIFSAGVNLKEYDKKFQLIEENPLEFEKTLKQIRQVLSKIELLKKPVIAGIDGITAGGAFEIALACDLILTSDKAQFCLNEINIGIIPGYGGIQRLIKSVGKNKTFELVSSGKMITAQEAMVLGIVAEIYTDSEFGKKSMEYCRKLSQKSSHALGLIKDTINQFTTKNSLDEIEVKNFIKAVSSSDAVEGINAFVEKREPEFNHNFKLHFTL